MTTSVQCYVSRSHFPFPLVPSFSLSMCKYMVVYGTIDFLDGCCWFLCFNGQQSLAARCHQEIVQLWNFFCWVHSLHWYLVIMLLLLFAVHFGHLVRQVHCSSYDMVVAWSIPYHFNCFNDSIDRFDQSNGTKFNNNPFDLSIMISTAFQCISPASHCQLKCNSLNWVRGRERKKTFRYFPSISIFFRHHCALYYCSLNNQFKIFFHFTKTIIESII